MTNELAERPLDTAVETDWLRQLCCYLHDLADIQDCHLDPMQIVELLDSRQCGDRYLLVRRNPGPMANHEPLLIRSFKTPKGCQQLLDELLVEAVGEVDPKTTLVYDMSRRQLLKWHRAFIEWQDDEPQEG